ncbi:peptidase inhibitor family I36 protein [Streptomyces sp. NBC_01077]|uniref:peptidase inhibitor family I36 protein n=1 Tax=Streptomyces sp. NBC_01077 TaxID=2903746 RepID=UPI0038659543
MIKQVAATLLAVSAILGATATNSSAISSDGWENGNCTADEFCLYRNTYYSGGVMDFLEGSGPYNNYNNYYFVNTATSVNNNASSSANNTVYEVRMYANTGLGGPSVQHRAVGSGCVSGICPAYHSLGWADNVISSHA